jgi:hypothetical protein
MSDLTELLEARVTRLERIVAAHVGNGASDPKLTADTIVYRMDDPRLVLYGAYDLEIQPNNKSFRWFGQKGLIQMVFPHGRGCAQSVRLLMMPYTGVDLGLIRIIADEARIVPQVSMGPRGRACMSFQLPAAISQQTEIQMHDVPVVSPKDSGADDERLLSFALVAAEFRAGSGQAAVLPVDDWL